MLRYIERTQESLTESKNTVQSAVKLFWETARSLDIPRMPLLWRYYEYHFFLKQQYIKKTKHSRANCTSALIIIQNFLLTVTSNEKRWQDENILFYCSFYASSVQECSTSFIARVFWKFSIFIDAETNGTKQMM